MKQQKSLKILHHSALIAKFMLQMNFRKSHHGTILFHSILRGF